MEVLLQLSGIMEPINDVGNVRRVKPIRNNRGKVGKPLSQEKLDKFTTDKEGPAYFYYDGIVTWWGVGSWFMVPPPELMNYDEWEIHYKKVPSWGRGTTELAMVVLNTMFRRYKVDQGYIRDISHVRSVLKTKQRLLDRNGLLRILRIWEGKSLSIFNKGGYESVSAYGCSPLGDPFWRWYDFSTIGSEAAQEEAQSVNKLHLTIKGLTLAEVFLSKGENIPPKKAFIYHGFTKWKLSEPEFTELVKRVVDHFGAPLDETSVPDDEWQRLNYYIKKNEKKKFGELMLKVKGEKGDTDGDKLYGAVMRAVKFSELENRRSGLKGPIVQWYLDATESYVILDLQDKDKTEQQLIDRVNRPYPWKKLEYKTKITDKVKRFAF